MFCDDGCGSDESFIIQTNSIYSELVHKLKIDLICMIVHRCKPHKLLIWKQTRGKVTLMIAAWTVNFPLAQYFIWLRITEWLQTYTLFTKAPINHSKTQIELLSGGLVQTGTKVTPKLKLLSLPFFYFILFFRPTAKMTYWIIPDRTIVLVDIFLLCFDHTESARQRKNASLLKRMFSDIRFKICINMMLWSAAV